MGLEDKAREKKENDSARERRVADAKMDHKTRQTELIKKFISALQKRGATPLPVHDVLHRETGFNLVTPKIIGNGWKISISDGETSHSIVVMTDGTLANSIPSAAIRPGRTKKFGISFRFFPEGEFIGTHEDMRSWFSIDNDDLEREMIERLAL